jgi:hemerythrin HHE cation binding domain-containing protein
MNPVPATGEAAGPGSGGPCAPADASGRVRTVGVEMDEMFSPSHTLHEEHVEFADDVEDLRRLADSVGFVPTNELRDRLCRVYDALTHRVIPHVMAEDGSPLGQVTATAVPNDSPDEPLAREHAEIGQLLSELDGLRWELAHPELAAGQQQALRRVLYGLFALIRTHLLGTKGCACDRREGRQTHPTA